MCKHCETYIEGGEECIMPLPEPETHQSSVQMCISGRNLLAVMLPPVVAGPIDFCPMCGRDLRGDES